MRGGLPGFEVYLDSNLNRQFDAGEPTRVTNAFGFYFFLFLEPGLYVVAEKPQAGWFQTFPGEANLGLHMFVLESGDLATGADFGNYRLGRISGSKFSDPDGGPLSGYQRVIRDLDRLVDAAIDRMEADARGARSPDRSPDR